MRELKKYLGGLFAGVCTLCLVSCYDETADIVFFTGDTVTEEGAIPGNRVTSVKLYSNGSETLNVGIAYGKGYYQAVTSDNEVVKVAVQDERLLLTRGTKEGNALVTVTDDKGNQASLAVTVGKGAYRFYFPETGYSVALQAGNPVDDEDLQNSVAGVMQDYRLLPKNASYLMIPDKLSALGTEGDAGKLIVYPDPEQQTSVEGTYTFAYNTTFNGEKQRGWEFAYSGETHHFLIAPRAGSRDVGPMILPLAEDVTAHYAASAADPLPENTAVWYFVQLESNGLRLFSDIAE